VLTDYISTEQYDQHNPDVADGLDALIAPGAKFGEQGKNLVYETIHKVIAEGDFVLLHSEGEFGGPVAYWDLFRVAGGKIVEHWDMWPRSRRTAARQRSLLERPNMTGFPFADGTYSDDGTGPRYEAVDGSTKGAVEDVHLQAAEIAPGV
jgi:predicted SnoaL-like aldol condensation-catalyzing enzyme